MQLNPITQSTTSTTQIVSTLKNTKDRLKATLGDFNTPIKNCCLELSTSVKDLIREAEKIALEKLSRKVLVIKTLAGGGFDTYAHNINDNQVQGGSPITQEDKDYFIVSTGSLGRADDFTINSDADFIVFPSNEESIPFAQVLQKEIRSSLTGLIYQNVLPFKTDEIMTGIYNCHVPPERANEELSKPYFDDFDAEFGMTIPRPSIIPHALLDMDFISGNREAYEKLLKVISPVLYPFSSGENEASANGYEIINLILGYIKDGTRKVIDINYSISCLKEDVLRLFHYHTWFTRSKEGIKTPSVFETLEKRRNSGSLSSEHARKLQENYDFFLKAKTALSIVREKIVPIRKEEKLSLTRDVLPQVAENLSMSPVSFRDTFSSKLFMTKAIINSDVNVRN